MANCLKGTLYGGRAVRVRPASRSREREASRERLRRSTGFSFRLKLEKVEETQKNFIRARFCLLNSLN